MAIGEEGASSQHSSQKRSWRGGCNPDQRLNHIPTVVILKRQMDWTLETTHRNVTPTLSGSTNQGPDDKGQVSVVMSEELDTEKRLNLVQVGQAQTLMISTDSTRAGQKKQEPAGHQTRNLKEKQQCDETCANNQDMERSKSAPTKNMAVC